MFPAWSVPPQHAETVGARRARLSREQETKRANSATSLSSEGTADLKADDDSNKSIKKGFFGWGSSKKSKEIQEITALPSLKTTPSVPEPTSQKPLDTPPLTPSSQQEYFASQLKPPFFATPPLPLLSQPIAPSSPLLSAGPAQTSSGATKIAGSDLDRIITQVSNASLSRPTAFSDRVTSLLPSPTSSDRTSYSMQSILSSSTNYDNVISEEGYQESCFSSNAQSEFTEYDCQSPKRLSEHCSKNTQSAFARALTKLENASPRIIAARLGEEWGRVEDDESRREIFFEQRLWAITAYQRLTQNRQLQLPAHDILSRSSPMDQRRILHLYGSLADGWMLASRYPAATVYTTSPTTNFSAPTSYTAPPNHHILYVPSLSSAMPFPDCYFDAIVSRSVSTVLQTDQWAQSFADFNRILKPGGQIDILSIDPHLSNEGQKLSSWVNEHIISKLEEQGINKLPSDTLLGTMEKVGLENIRRARVALPGSTSLPRTKANGVTPPQDMADSIRMMAFLGRHFYQDLYGKALELGQDKKWFWARKDIQHECERLQTKIMVTIACAQKPADPVLGESHISR